MTNPDKRLNAWRDDLADARLRGTVNAERYAQGVPMRVVCPRAGLHASADESSMMIAECLMGDDLLIFENRNGWAWGQLQKDNYVGYVKTQCLAEGWKQATHKVSAVATFIYPKADLKSTPAVRIFMNSHLVVDSIKENWAHLEEGGYVYEPHICDLATFHEDPVSVAEGFINVPYLWAGATQDGLDCSALVQQAYHACGLACPRDSDMIEAEIGEANPNNLKRGDLVFWDGHVGMMQDDTFMIHANGYHMAVKSEEFAKAQARINAEYGSTARVKRPKS